MLKYLTPLALLISTAAYEREVDVSVYVSKAIRTLTPQLAKKEANKLARVILDNSQRYGLDWKVMVAIISQESGFRMDPQQCGKKLSKCSDFGIAQINYRAWGLRLGLDRKLLISDPGYAIERSAYILSILKQRYGTEQSWYTRYHSGTPFRRREYAKKLTPKLAKLSNWHTYANGKAYATR